MDELISKRAVIEAIEKARANVGHNLERSIGKSIIEILDDVGRDVDRMPSALGTNLAEVGRDCISRQAAINALSTITMYKGSIPFDTAVMRIEQLPSAQPEQLGTNLAEVGTDTISRQAAIDGKICIQRANGVEIYDDYAVPVEYLEQLPPAQPEQLGTNLAEVGTDCISREQAIDAVRATLLAWSYMPEWRDNKVIEAIKRLPPIQPAEPKRGKWIDKGITGDWQYQIDGRGRSWHEWQCDQCKDMVKKRSFYCPNCGADMRGEQDG